MSRPWLHHNPGGYAFRPDARLEKYELEVDGDAMSGQSVVEPRRLAGCERHALAGDAVHASPGGPSPITQTVALVQNGLNTYHAAPALSACQPACTTSSVQVGDDTQFLRPLWIKNSGEPAASPQFGSLTPNIGLAAAQTQLRDPDRLDVLLQWAITGVTDANYGISLRLHDAAGKVWTSLDTQPGYGFQPTSAWQPGTLNDAYTLDLPGDLPRDQAYALDVILYRVASQAGSGPHDHRRPAARSA